MLKYLKTTSLLLSSIVLVACQETTKPMQPQTSQGDTRVTQSSVASSSTTSQISTTISDQFKIPEGFERVTDHHFVNQDNVHIVIADLNVDSDMIEDFRESLYYDSEKDDNLGELMMSNEIEWSDEIEDLVDREINIDLEDDNVMTVATTFKDPRDESRIIYKREIQDNRYTLSVATYVPDADISMVPGSSISTYPTVITFTENQYLPISAESITRVK